MSSRILVPLDGSPVAEQALSLAASFAHVPGTTVFLVHVHTALMPVMLGPLTLGEIPVDDETWDRERRDEERRYLETQGRWLAALCSCSITVAILDGPVPEALVGYVDELGIDLVVMTTHGHGGWALSWLGSTANAFIHASHVPVMLVCSASDTWTPDHVIKRILIPLDGSDCAEQVLEPALQLPVPAHVEYSLVRVIEPLRVPRYPPLAFAAAAAQEATDGLYEDACTYLEHIAERLRRSNLRVQTEVILHEHPAQCILSYAHEAGADVIALATHGRGNVRRLLLGSVADKVVRGADRPVLIVRPALAVERS